MVETFNSKQKIARTAGLLYLMLAITSAYGLMYVSSQIYISGDAIATADNILANEFLYRSGIFSNLISQAIFIFLVFTLYRLFKEVNIQQARIMVTLVIVSIPIVFVSEVFEIIALLILKGEALKALDPQLRPEWAMLFQKMNSTTTLVAVLFWGLWLIPFGQLAYKSGFIPKVIGILLIVGGVAYVIQVATALLFPEFKSIVSKWTSIFPTVAELSTILWLLIKGVSQKTGTSSVL